MLRQKIEIGVGSFVFTLAALLGVGHIFDVLDKFMPEQAVGMITDKGLIYTMAAGLIVAVIGWFDFKHEKGKHGTSSEPSHTPPITNTNTATATGGSVLITNTFQVPVDELAEAVAKRVRQEILNPGDGFVQLDDKRLELQVPSNPLRANGLAGMTSAIGTLRMWQTDTATIAQLLAGSVGVSVNWAGMSRMK